VSGPFEPELAGPGPDGAAGPSREPVPGSAAPIAGAALDDVEAEVDAEARLAGAGPDPGAELDPKAELDAGADLDAGQAQPEPDPLAVLSAERDDYLDSLRRLQADFENYKKRIARQQAEQAERAAERLVDKLLPVLDTADLALSHGGGEDVAQLRGVLLSALEREGLARIEPLDKAFDPNEADAVAHEPGDEDSTMTVVEVLRAGYRWKGRVLRPAMVKVRG
jgi:molecular chaperone GrpE